MHHIIILVTFLLLLEISHCTKSNAFFVEKLNLTLRSTPFRKSAAAPSKKSLKITKLYSSVIFSINKASIVGSWTIWEVPKKATQPLRPHPPTWVRLTAQTFKVGAKYQASLISAPCLGTAHFWTYFMWKVIENVTIIVLTLQASIWPIGIWHSRIRRIFAAHEFRRRSVTASSTISNQIIKRLLQYL